MTATASEASDVIGWALAGQFLDAFTRRDFAVMATCLSPDIHFRALIPPGVIDVTGPDATIEYFQRWFAEYDQFDVVDASLGQLGPLIYLRWRMNIATADEPTSARVVEQHLYAAVSDRIDALDLLCSGKRVPA